MRKPVPLVRVEKLRKRIRFGGRRVVAFDGLSFDLKRRESLAVLDPTGIFAASLLPILACLDRPTSGRCRVAGRSVSSLSQASLAALRRDTIGFVPRDPRLFSHLTVLENVERPLHSDEEKEPEHRRSAMGLARRLGLGRLLNDRPVQLTGGEQKRVALARALVTDPEIILLDGIEDGIDLDAAEDLLTRVLEFVSEGKAAIWVTRETVLAERARWVLRVDQGRASVARSGLCGTPADS